MLYLRFDTSISFCNIINVLQTFTETLHRPIQFYQKAYLPQLCGLPTHTPSWQTIFHVVFFPLYAERHLKSTSVAFGKYLLAPPEGILSRLVVIRLRGLEGSTMVLPLYNRVLCKRSGRVHKSPTGSTDDDAYPT